MRHSPLNPPPELLAVLAGVVAGITAVRAQLHALQAAEALLLQAGDLVAREMAVAGSGLGRKPTESALNMAYRAVQTEIGAAVHESDRTVAVKMGRATELVERYPEVYRALTRGVVSGAHANAIVDAGEVIEDAAARERYAARVLAFAEVESVARLRPVAKLLAAECAGVSREERCERARALRRVFVVEREDGMADLTAYLPAPYAYGIKDRLDQLARLTLDERARVAKAAQAAACAGAGGDTEASASASADPGAGGDVGAGTTENGPADNRTADQLRADLLTDMLLATDFDQLRTGGAPAQNVSARVQVVVPVRRIRQGARGVTGSTRVAGGTGMTPDSGLPGSTGSVRTAREREFASLFAGFVTGNTEDAGDDGTRAPNVGEAPDPSAGIATLEGYGPIGDADALEIAAHAACWEQVSVDADTGTVISVDTYRPSAAQRRFLGARDLHCRFPGCRAALAWCDIDHTIDAALGGPTSSDNLGHLCRRHHTLKHATPWTVTQDAAGEFTWVSPTGRTYVDRPESNVRFRAVDEFEGTAPPSRTAPPPGETGERRGKTREPWGKGFLPLKARGGRQFPDSDASEPF